MIVSNASTLILIAKAELLDKFVEHVGQEIGIPKEVERECCGAQKSLDALLIQKAIQEEKIRVSQVRNRKLCDQVRRDFNLGKGESEAIALAFSKKAHLVALDDKSGINACKLLRIPFTTAIDILIRMRERGLLAQEEALTKLDILAHYGRYTAGMVKDAREKLEVKK